MRIGLLISMLLMQWCLSGQVTLTVDKTEIRIGDQVHAILLLQGVSAGEWVNQEKVWPDSMKGIEVISGPMLNQEKTEASWTLGFFDTGYVRIPPVPIVLQRQGKSDTLFTLDIPVKVLPVEPDTSGLLAIKDIYVNPFSIAYYKKYLPHALVVLLLLAAAWYWWKKGKENGSSATTSNAIITT